jgi:hypothetical protein
MSIALLIASLLSGVIQGIPQISALWKQIVADIDASLSAVVASGVTTTVNPSTILQALAGVIAALKADPNLPADKLALIAALESAAVAALAADQAAQQKVDPGTLQPITPLP